MKRKSISPIGLRAFSWVVTLSCMILTSTASDSLPIREVTSQAMRSPNYITPGFYQGYVFFLEGDRHNQIRLFSPDGQLALTKNFYDIKQRPVAVTALAVDKDGTLAIGWSELPAIDDNFAGIDLLDVAGKLLRSIKTGAYIPTHLAFGDQHSIWAFGWQRDQHDPLRASNDYLTVHRYLADGREVAAFLPRSSFPRGLEPACGGWQQRGIEVARDRIGVLACSGTTSARSEWLELDHDGKIVGRWQIGFSRTVTLTQDGNVYAQNTNT